MFFTLESPYPYFCCNLRYNVMPFMYSEMQNKLSKTRESPLESMGQIISSRCPVGAIYVYTQGASRSFVKRPVQSCRLGFRPSLIRADQHAFLVFLSVLLKGLL